MYEQNVQKWDRKASTYGQNEKYIPDINLMLSFHGVRGNISTLNLLILPILFNYFA